MYAEKYIQVISMFTCTEMPLSIVDGYLSGTDDGAQVIVDEINKTLKTEFYWCTGISILEIVEHLVKESIDNENI